MDSALQNMNPVLQMLTVMSLFSLLPFVFCCMTSFLRFTIVFSLLKTAMGVQVPPSIVTIGLCMILTFYTMGGVFEQMYQRGSVPYQKTQNLIVAIDEGSEPLKEFMDHLTSWRIPGNCIRIALGGKEVFRYESGYSDLENKVPMTGEGLVNIYSCSKPITVTAAP